MMPTIKYAEAFHWVARMPVFTVRHLRGLGVPGDYAKARLHQLAHVGRIRHVERGKYTVLDDPQVVAVNLTQPCYLGYWTALSIRGLTDQIPSEIEVVTSRRRFRGAVDFQPARIVFHMTKPSMMYGYEMLVDAQGARLPVARPEKVVVDSIVSGRIPADELGPALEASDARTLLEYARLSRNHRAIDFAGRTAC